MTPTVIEITRPQAAAADRPMREVATSDDLRRLLRALAGTDEDELPLFGRIPG